MGIEIRGIAEIAAKLNKVADMEALEKAMQNACLLVEGDARRKAPKNKGDLKRSIESKVEVGGDKITGIVYCPLEYAPYVEYGTGLFAEKHGRTNVPWCYKDDEGKWHTTSGQHPQPFLRPALNENRTKIIEMLKGGFK